MNKIDRLLGSKNLLLRVRIDELTQFLEISRHLLNGEHEVFKMISEQIIPNLLVLLKLMIIKS